MSAEILALVHPKDDTGLEVLKKDGRWKVNVVSIHDGSELGLYKDEWFTKRVSSAHVILLVEPWSAVDAEGRYARGLGHILAAFPREARARCVSCSLGDRGQPVRIGPNRRSLGDLTQSKTLDLLAELIKRQSEKPSSDYADDGPMISDRPAEADEVGFAPAVKTLASFLADPTLQPPLVVSVEGGWGSGKSSFLLQLRRELRKRYSPKPELQPLSRDPSQIRTVWVNTWSSDSEASAYTSFALALIDELGRVNPLQAAMCRIRLAWLRFDWNSGWKDVVRMTGGFALLLGAAAIAIWGLPARVEEGLAASIDWVKAGTVAVLGGLSIQGIRQLRDFFGSPFTVDLRQHMRVPEAGRSPGELHIEDISRIIQAYSGKAKRIFVFVDDLDRSDPAKVADVTKTINIILAHAGKQLIYILAIDREKVAAAIAARSKEVASLVTATGPKGSMPIDFGHMFLEKLIQVPFRVPTVPSGMLARWIDATIGSTPTQLQQTVALVAPFLGENPRRIKQFVNLLRLRVRLIRDQPGNNPSLLGLGKLTAAEILFPAFIRDMAAAPYLLQTLLLGMGEGIETEAYRRWSAYTDLLDLLNWAPEGKGPLDEILLERRASLLDIDLDPILRLCAPTPSSQQVVVESLSMPESSTSVDESQEALRRYAREYERIRRTVRFSSDRTTKLDRLFHDMGTVRGVPHDQALVLYHSGEPGLRIATLAVIEAEAAPWAGSILQDVLTKPWSPFEDYHALRLARGLWDRMVDEDRHAIAQIVSTRWVSQEAKRENDSARWQLTQDLLTLAEKLPLVDEIAVEIPNRGESLPYGSLRIPLSRVPSFDALTDIVYKAIEPTKRPYRYGVDWVLSDDETRLVEKVGVHDDRPLAALGIVAGRTLSVTYLRPPAPLERQD